MFWNAASELVFPAPMEFRSSKTATLEIVMEIRFSKFSAWAGDSIVFDIGEDP